MLYFIPTPIGNLSDISSRALELLKSVKTIVCEDTRSTKALCHLLNQKYDLDINPNSFLSLHTHNEKEFFTNLKPELFEEDLAYVSDAGMPGLSDPGVALIRYAQEQKLSYEVLPGANAALLGLVASGLCDKEFTFIGFLPSAGRQREKELEKVLLSPYPCVLYESPLRILKLVQEVVKLDPQRELFLIKEASKKFETKFKGTAQSLIKALSKANCKGEWCAVVSKAKKEYENSTLVENDILSLQIPPKIKAKLLAKLSGKSPKQVYQELLEKG